MIVQTLDHPDQGQMRQPEVVVVPLDVATADIAMRARKPDLLGRRAALAELLKLGFGPNARDELRSRFVQRDSMKPYVDARAHVGVVKLVFRTVGTAEKSSRHAERTDGVENAERAHAHCRTIVNEGRSGRVERRAKILPFAAEPVLGRGPIELPRARFVLFGTVLGAQQSDRMKIAAQ